MKVKSESEVAQLAGFLVPLSEVAQACLNLRPQGLQPTRLLRSWDFPGKSTGVGCHCLLHLNHEAVIITGQGKF